MTISPVSSSVAAAALTTTYNVTTKHKPNETASTAINIGNLEEQGITLSVSDQGTDLGVPSTATFTLLDDDNLFLGVSFQNLVDEATTRIQIYDGGGNVIADNQGTAAQQTIYAQIASSGYSPGAGTYTVVATPPPYAEAPAVVANAITQQGTSLDVRSQLTSADPSEYYNFSFGSGNNLKLAFDAEGSNSSVRVQLYNATGHVVADSRGNSFQRQAYVNLTSGTGLTAAAGDYSVKVSYAPGASTDQSPRYNFQLYSGKNYAVVYRTNVSTPPGDNSAAASVTAASDAKLYTRQDYHSIKETAASGVNIGWIQQNKTSLDVRSLLTSFDSSEYYNFTLQIGNNLKFAFQNTTNTAALRVQLFDSSGTKIVADSQGTKDQQAAYKSLTSATGLDAKTGQYVIKVQYAKGVSKTAQQDYNFQVFSGTGYSSSYRTLASAQTYRNAFLSGDIGTGYNAATATASYLNNYTQGIDQPDLFTLLSKLV